MGVFTSFASLPFHEASWKGAFTVCMLQLFRYTSIRLTDSHMTYSFKITVINQTECQADPVLKSSMCCVQCVALQRHARAGKLQHNDVYVPRYDICALQCACRVSIPKLYPVLLLHIESRVCFSRATGCVMRLQCNAEELYSKHTNASLLSM